MNAWQTFTSKPIVRYPSRLSTAQVLLFSLLLSGFVGIPQLLGDGNSRLKTPNIVFILAEDLGYGDLSSYGASLVKTPNIDQLAREGKTFTDAHSPHPVCTPTRYSLMTDSFAIKTYRRLFDPGYGSIVEIV